MKASKGLKPDSRSMCVQSITAVLSAQERNTTRLIVITQIFLWKRSQSLRNVSHTASPRQSE